MKGFFVGLSKVVLGIALALMLLSMAGVATARYFMARLSVLPPKPLYGDEQAAVAPAAEATAAPTVPAEPPPPEAVPATAATEPALAPGTYKALVVQPIGLIMREGPGTEHAQVGGVDYNESLIVLEEPADQGWIKVRVVANGQEGWVKAGNTQKVEP